MRRPFRRLGPLPRPAGRVGSRPRPVLGSVGLRRLAGSTAVLSVQSRSARRTGNSACRVGEVAEAPLPKSDKPLHFDEKAGMRIRWPLFGVAALERCPDVAGPP